MLHIKFLRLLAIFALALGSTELLASSSTVIYAVGTCKPTLPSYVSISAALAAIPAPNVVQVCPGTYNEQVQITQPVTLQGISTGDSAQSIVAPPSGGLVANATDDFGNPVAAQLWVNSATGPVNISDLTVDAAGNGITGYSPIVGIFYQNSAGTVNRVTTRNQSGNRGGIGILAEGGASNPSVTVENSSIYNFDAWGVETETNSGVSELTATIKNNYVQGMGVNSFTFGILIESGAISTVTNNVVIDGNTGVYVQASAVGSVSGNTVANNLVGILVYPDGTSIIANKIFGSTVNGIYMANTSVAVIQGNSITGSPVGIEFNCGANSNAHSNTITDVGTALDSVPSGLAVTNSYFNVGTIRTSCGPVFHGS
jgi:parallel beta-helix repeat protein